MKPAVAKRWRRRGAIAAICAMAVGIAGVLFLDSYLWAGDRGRPKLSSPEVSVLATERNGARDVNVLRVMTLNLAHGRKAGRHQLLRKGSAFRSNLDDVAAVLRREGADVIGLQEADGPSSWSGKFDHVQYLAGQAGYGYSVRGDHVKTKKLRYGTAVMSKLPMADPLSGTFDPSRPTPSKGFVVCTIDWPGPSEIQVDVVSVHLDFARKSVRQKQVEELVRELAARGRPMIVVGDFNSEWTAKGSALRTLAEALNLKAYRPEAEGMDTFSKLNRRFDWLLISPEFEFSTYRSLTDRISDHLAVVAEIGIVED